MVLIQSLLFCTEIQDASNNSMRKIINNINIIGEMGKTGSILRKQLDTYYELLD